MHLLPLGWTIVIHYYQVVLIPKKSFSANLWSPLAFSQEPLKRDYISPILASLHWVPVKSRAELKITFFI